MIKLTQEYLLRVCNYDKLTGVLSYKVRVNNNSRVGRELGSITAKGYRRASVKGTPYMVHRLIYLYLKGYMPEQVDHINGDREDNRWSNLREATNGENGRNRKTPENTTTGIKGLSHREDRQEYVGNVNYEGQRYTRSRTYTLENKEEVKQEVIKWIYSTRKELHREFTNHG